jgi:5-oxoprolinase (ATP-hydrolysing) subunit B
VTKLLRYGDRGVLVECDEGVDPVGFRDALLAGPVPGVLQAVPGARTVLVEIDPTRTSFGQLGTHVAAMPVTTRPTTGPVADAPAVEIAVRYDGPDLAAVAQEIGADVDAVVELHSRARYRVGFCGFAPGFAYLTGLDPALRLPRLAEPRTAVPAGSVAIADEFTAVYPRRSPGGWRLIGSTSVAMWQLDRDPPALLAPGATVRFVPS